MHGKRIFTKPIRRKQRQGKIAEGRYVFGALKVVPTPEDLVRIPKGALQPYEPILVLNPGSYWSCSDIANSDNPASWNFFEHPFEIAKRTEAKLELLMFKNDLELDFVNSITLNQASAGQPISVTTEFNHDFDTLPDKWLLDEYVKFEDPIPAGSVITLFVDGIAPGNEYGEPFELEEDLYEAWGNDLRKKTGEDDPLIQLQTRNNETYIYGMAIWVPGSDPITMDVTFQLRVTTEDDGFEFINLLIKEETTEATFNVIQ